MGIRRQPNRRDQPASSRDRRVAASIARPSSCCKAVFAGHQTRPAPRQSFRPGLVTFWRKGGRGLVGLPRQFARTGDWS
jgi:hypothetical protein